MQRAFAWVMKEGVGSGGSALSSSSSSELTFRGTRLGSLSRRESCRNDPFAKDFTMAWAKPSVTCASHPVGTVFFMAGGEGAGLRRGAAANRLHGLQPRPFPLHVLCQEVVCVETCSAQILTSVRCWSAGYPMVHLPDFRPLNPASLEKLLVGCSVQRRSDTSV